MKMLILFSVIFCLCACSSETAKLNIEQTISDNAKNMTVGYQVLSNTRAIDCDESIADGFCYNAQLSLNFSTELPKNGWEIYFSHLSPIQSIDSNTFTIERINGDLHKLTALRPIEANHNYTIGIKAAFWSVSKSDVLPNYFFVYGENKTATINGTVEIFTENSPLPTLPHAGELHRANQIKRQKDDNSVYDSASVIYERNNKIHITAQSSEKPWLATPSIKQKQLSEKTLNVSQGLTIDETTKGLFPAAWSLLKQSGVAFDDSGIRLHIDINQQAQLTNGQGYELEITSEKISIKALSNAGAFYALMSLNQLFDKNTLPVGVFTDAPRYAFRGIHLDVARNFRSVEFVKALIQDMAQWKLNKLHLHLADDEGWRLEINGLKELTEVGAFRCFDPSETQCLMPQLGAGPNRSNPNNGYYSTLDYNELLQYAAAHQVEIIPSLDMPGHSRSSIKSMEARYHRLINAEQPEAAQQYLLSDFEDKSQYSSVQHYSDNTLNPCLESTYTFVDKVLTDLIAQHKAAGVPLTRYHLGADETAGAWHGSPACETFISNNPSIENVEQLGSYFITRVAQLVQAQGIIAGGWSDGMREFQPNVKNPMQVNVWDPLMWQGHLAAEKFAAQGWHTILSYPDVLYFDFPYAVDPNEPGYYWATRATDSYKLFQFMPDTPEINDALWKDRLGNAYKAELSKKQSKTLSNTQSKTESKAEYEGIQAHLWSEIVRHDSVAQYMYYPRLISFAQKAWAKSPWESSARELNKEQLEVAINQDWALFRELLVTKHLPKLVEQGIQFRLPPPGAIIDNGTLKMNHLFNGVQLEYQQTLGQWKTYSRPILVKQILKIRAKLDSAKLFGKPHFDKPRYSAEIELKKHDFN